MKKIDPKKIAKVVNIMTRRLNRSEELEAKSVGQKGRAGLRDWQYDLVQDVRMELEE